MSGLLTRPPFPKTLLGVHRQLGPNAGIFVSPIQLGAMNIGDKWNDLGMGAMDKENSFKLLDAYYESGDETSEEYIGEWAEKRGIRDQLIIATKYTSNYKRGATDIPQKTNYNGNNTKSMHLSVEASLKKLRTDYIDIFYLHWWDYSTSVEEVVNSLHNLVVSGKVLYLGISDTPAWIVAQANTYAKDHGKTPFVIYQGAWNILQRDFEREIIPMAKAFGMALAPWNVLGGGRIRTDAEEQRRRETGEKGRRTAGPEWERTPSEVSLSHALEKVAKEIGAKSITSIAIAYVMQKAPYVFPIIGGRKIEHLQANLEALELRLEKSHIEYLESIIPFDKGFPYGFGDGSDFNPFFKSAGYFDKWPVQEPIRPAGKKN
ncbi:NADP-dependent oxidoreductase domain superfamily protein [Abortiporus biennis]